MFRIFHISGKDILDGIKWLKISNLKGKLVYFKDSFSDYNNGLLDINPGSIPAGIYNIEIFSHDYIINKNWFLLNSIFLYTQNLNLLLIYYT